MTRPVPRRAALEALLGPEDVPLIEILLAAPATLRRQAAGGLVWDRDAAASLRRLMPAAAALRTALDALSPTARAVVGWALLGPPLPSLEDLARAAGVLADELPAIVRGRAHRPPTISAASLHLAHYVTRALALADARDGHPPGPRCVTSSEGPLAQVLRLLLPVAEDFELSHTLRRLVPEARRWAAWVRAWQLAGRAPDGLPRGVVLRNPSPPWALLRTAPVARRGRDRASAELPPKSSRLPR